MAHVLHIQASPRGDESFSIRAARAFLDACAEAHPDDTVETLDLPADPPVEFRGDEAAAKLKILAGETPTDEERQAWEAVVATIDHFKKADKVVVSSPMWNFGLPYRLKQYLDVIIQPRETFQYTESGQAEGLVTGRPAMLILARGGEYGPGTAGEAMDYQLPYLKAALGFIGFERIEAILVEPTVGKGPDAARAALDAAVEEARATAAAF
jgi:FMN-dependent NADH-azoreductase